VTGRAQPPAEVVRDMSQEARGRFRQKLLVSADTSGRSVIVSGPSVRMHQCGRPKLMRSSCSRRSSCRAGRGASRPQKHQGGQDAGRLDDPGGMGRARGSDPRAPGDANRAPTLHRLGSRRSSRCWSRASDQGPPARATRLKRTSTRPDGGPHAAVGRGPAEARIPDAVGEKTSVAGRRCAAGTATRTWCGRVYLSSGTEAATLAKMTVHA